MALDLSGTLKRLHDTLDDPEGGPLPGLWTLLVAAVRRAERAEAALAVALDRIGQQSHMITRLTEGRK
jgi:hypothetical protein